MKSYKITFQDIYDSKPPKKLIDDPEKNKRYICTALIEFEGEASKAEIDRAVANLQLTNTKDGVNKKVRHKLAGEPVKHAEDNNTKVLIKIAFRAPVSGGNYDLLRKSPDETGALAPAAQTLKSTLVKLEPASVQRPTKDVALWKKIKRTTSGLSFKKYLQFMDWIFCGDGSFDSDDYRHEIRGINKRRKLPFIDTDAYRAIKVVTESFVMVNLGRGGKLEKYLEEISVGEGSIKILPYMVLLKNKLPDLNIKELNLSQSLQKFLDGDGPAVTNCNGLILERLTRPIYIELIWSYWHEEAMLVQGMNAICRRFQNIKSSADRDPLAHVEIGPLRPLNNLLWGYIQDEQHRLTVKRRAYEYDHHYGLTLQGKAVQGIRPADTRSKFIEAFHNLLHITSRFYKQHDDTTIVADGFPVLNVLKEVHLILSEGAHNQYGDLPSTARIEMMMQQYLLSRPEFREFLPSRQMVAYPEPWMDRVQSLNNMMGWTPTSVMHFRDLGYFGEQILLSVRFGAWTTVVQPVNAANWAIFWRAEIQNYIHAYRAVTGIDLSNEMVPVDYGQPSLHLLRVMKEQVRKSA